ncbi:MAG: uroporphyrinogen decarboxylase family protein [Victivallales bacterium]
MNTRERFRAAMDFQSIDRLPAMEWICWWDKTIERWRSEGLPQDLKREDILRFFGLEVHERIWISPRFQVKRQVDKSRNDGIIETEADYERLILPCCANPVIDLDGVKRLAERQKRGDTVFQLVIDGFFWYPREIFGVERHLFAFYDQPELMRRMNEDLCQYHLSILDQVLEITVPDVLLFAEDMSYNNGPMLSREQFEEYVAPYYRRIIPRARDAGAISLVDTDGDMTAMIPWLQEAGIEGCSPLERMAGVDVVGIRKSFPKWKMIGGFDKTIMHLGETAIRKEFERLLPAILSGGYIPTTDHQTPPDVSLETFRTYVGLLKEYCGKAAGGAELGAEKNQIKEKD